MRKIKNRRLSKILPLMLACAGMIGYQSTAFAEDVRPSTSINNKVTVDEKTYDVNGSTAEYEGDIDVVYGGGGETNENYTTSNGVTINGGEIGAVIGGVAASGDAAYNVVEINGGNISGVTGGLTVVNHELNNEAGAVTGNRIMIHGGTIQFVSGGEVAYTYYADGSNGVNEEILALATGNVTDNVVEINGGTINGRAVGGVALGGDAVGNAVVIGGGKVEGSIIGGMSEAGNATDNTVEIKGSPDLIDAYLYGGWVDSDKGGISSNNTLKIRTTGITARNISGFQNLNFDLPEETHSGDTVLTLTEGKTNLVGTHLSIYVDGAAPIDKGSQLNLIVNQNGLDTTSEMSTNYALDDGTTAFEGMTHDSVMNRGAVGYGLSLNNDGTNFTATVGDKVSTQTVVPLPHIPLPDLNFNVGSEQEGEFDDTKVEDVEHVREQRGYEIFINNGGGHIKTKFGNGSYITNDMGTHDIGIARHFRRDNGVLTFAPVFTYSYGNYNAHLPSGARGGGNQNYAAGGVIVRNFNNSGFYYESSFRAGRSNTKYVTDDFPLENHPHMSYNVDSTVLLGHVRVGNQWRLGKDHILDVYGYYAYARQGSADAELNLGNHCSFSSTDSGRLRTGYRLTSRLNRISQLYTGLAFQYDTHSNSISKVEKVEANRLADGDNITFGKDGSSGMLEIGWLMKPLKDNPWTLDIHATGWVGMQQGVTAMAKVKKAF